MIYLGSDHAGYELKQDVMRHLKEQEVESEDLGNTELDKNDDYPDYGFAIAEAIRKQFGSYGILICGSAQGVCIAANKVPGVRAAHVKTVKEARLIREHNNANVICLSGWEQTIEDVGPLIDAFLGTPFSDEERHHRRVGKITDYEESHLK